MSLISIAELGLCFFLRMYRNNNTATIPTITKTADVADNAAASVGSSREP